MAQNEKPLLNNPLNNASNIIVAAIVMMIIGIMILPMPTFLMDVFLVMNITGALVILFVSMYVNKPLQFSVFPSVLLIITLFRLSLNVGTTRLILGKGYAGEIIESFGSFVAGGNYVVGIVIFLVLVLINFVVITKGAGRIAEVSARFTLDAMPGKQMAIDADLNAGLIDDVEAKERREIISQEASFHGAMDGASKFVRGDAVAGLIMTGINIVGGLLIGVAQMGMTFSASAQKFTLLTIGDGLVAQLPALIISTAAGIIVTRATGDSDFGEDIRSQISNQPRAVIVSSGVLGILGLVPGLPFLPFAIMATIVAVGGFLSQNAIIKKLELDSEEDAEEVEVEDEKIESFLHPDPFEIEIGETIISIPDWVKAVFGLSLPIMANIAEIVRGAVQSVPTGQWEASESLAFSRRQTLWQIILPQCFKRMIPPWMNWYAILTMATPLVSLLGVEEIVTLSRQAMEAEDNHPELLIPFYGFALVIFFAYCYPIARWTLRLEERYSVKL